MKNLLAVEGLASNKQRGSLVAWVAIAGGLVLAIGLAVVITLIAVDKINLGKWVSPVADKATGWLARPKAKDADKASGYSAVFLANGQVYFGKLSKPTSQYVSLTDVFYLRIQQPLQPPSEEDEDTPKRETQLIKLGQELHGPVDEIKINRDQVLFIETMKSDSRVVQGIKQYYEQKK